ncbi:MAG: patatin-like phospholipase family protein [Akkermansiaceae bacterium]|nr:patatin-like phospholipase family protein [Akkermansiaceae bacterium]NNM29964.1 patatin-like phospholipase family protein [Akkermansiaceae bacterium]
MPWSLRSLFARRKAHHERHDRASLDKIPHLKLGLALSAGGAKGLAHVGVLQVFEEHGIEIDAISGSSMGSYVGALWACGYSGPDLQELAEEMHDRKQLRKLADPIIPPLTGLFRGERAKRHLMESIGETRFEDLARRLLIVTFDLDTKERLVLRRGVVADAVHASCAMPGIVAPVMLDGHRCCDGGVVDPLPVGSLRKFTDVDVVIGVNVLPTLQQVDTSAHEDEPPPAPPSPWKRLGRGLNRSINLAAHGNVIDTLRKSIKAAQLRIAQESTKNADLCLHPRFELPGLWHDYSNFAHYIEAGRAAAAAQIDTIKTMLNQRPPRTNEPAQQPMVGENVA